MLDVQESPQSPTPAPPGPPALGGGCSLLLETNAPIKTKVVKQGESDEKFLLPYGFRVISLPWTPKTERSFSGGDVACC